MRVAVVGGTGLAGRHAVLALRAAGHDAVPISRSTGADVVTGIGLDAALRGVEAVVDLSDPRTLSKSKARAFFEASAAHLQEAEARAGVQHHVVLSIVGVDRVATGYYAAKLLQEELALAGAVPATILRATQFCEFPAQLLDRVPGPVVPIPRMRSQPVAVREVAAVLAALATGDARERAPDLAGPEVLEMPDLVRRTARARGRQCVVLGLCLPGEAARAARTGALLPRGEARLGTVTFDQHLTELRAG